MENQLRTDNVAALWAEYVTHTLDVDESHPLTTIGPLRHVFGNLQEFTSTLDLPDVWVLVGRSWAMAPFRTHLASGITCEYNEPGAIMSSFEVGFRCAKSIDVPRCLTDK